MYVFYDIGSDGMVIHGKELLIRLQYVFCIMSRENNDRVSTRATFIIVDCMLR